MEELRGELSRLADDTVVLYLTMFQNAAGKTFTPRQALDAFAPASAFRSTAGTIPSSGMGLSAARW